MTFTQAREHIEACGYCFADFVAIVGAFDVYHVAEVDAFTRSAGIRTPITIH